MKNATLSFLIVAIAAVGACNRTADRAPSSGPQAAAPSTPPSSGPQAAAPDTTAAVNQPSSGAVQPQALSGPGTSNEAETSSKELSKQEESTGQPRPGTGGADHSTPAREPGAK